MKTLHSYWQTRIREKLRASFVGWEKAGEELSLKIIINGNVSRLPLPKGHTFDNVNAETYIDLYEKI